MAKSKICSICGMKNCKCDHTTKAVPALMGDPRPHKKVSSVFKSDVENRDGSSIAAEGMSAANYSMHKRGAKMRKDSGGGGYVEPKYKGEIEGGKGKGNYAGAPNAGVPPMYPKGSGYAGSPNAGPPPSYPRGPIGATVTASGGKPGSMVPMAPTPSSKLPPRAPSPSPVKAKKMAKSSKKVSKAMPMPMTPSMPSSSLSARPMPPKMPPPAPSMVRPNRPATMPPPMASGSGLAPMTKGKKVSKAASFQDRVKREVGALNDFIVGSNYRGIPSTGNTVMRESGSGTPGWKVKYTESPTGKPGSFPGTKGAKKMAKSDSGGQGAYINGKPAHVTKRSK